MGQHSRSKPIVSLMCHDDATDTDAFVIRTVLFDPAHVTRDLADDFIVSLVPLEFDDDMIVGNAIPGNDVDPSQCAAFHLSVAVLKLARPRERLPLLNDQIFEVLFQRNPQVKRLRRSSPHVDRDYEMPAAFEMIEEKRYCPNGPARKLLYPASVLNREVSVRSVPPLELQPHRIVIGNDFATTSGIMHFSRESSVVDLGATFRLALDQKDLGLAATIAAGSKRTFDAAGLGMLETDRPLSPTQRCRGKSLVSRSMRCGDEFFEEVFLPSSGHLSRLMNREWSWESTCRMVK